MDFRAPYSPPPPARKPRQPAEIPEHFRHDHPHPQIPWSHRASGAGGRVGADDDGGGADAVACELRLAAGDLLCRRRHGLGAAGDADRELDVAARMRVRMSQACSASASPERRPRPTGSPASRAASACRPSQAMRGSARRLVRPSASTMPGIVDTALANPASSAITTCARRKESRSPNG